MSPRLEYRRELLPDPETFYTARGLHLRGRGPWRTATCEFHGGSDSMRINLGSGGWVCMACGAKGGDVLAYAMQADGLEFMTAAQALGAVHATPGPGRVPDRQRMLSPRDAMEAIAHELSLTFVVVSDVRGGIVPTDADWQRFVQAAGRVEAIVEEFRV